MAELKELPKVASSLPYECKKCGHEKYHRVLVHKTPKSAQIECEACGSKKTIKIGVKKKRATRKKTATKKNDAPAVWENLNSRIGTEKLELYRMSSSYEVDQALDHPKFGKGFVTKVSDGQIEVVFQEEYKTLVHNY